MDNFKPYPVALIALQAEIPYHPELVRQLIEYRSVDAPDIGEKLGIIAAYCEVILDGYYTAEDQLKLADVLWNKLRDKRKEVVTDPTSPQLILPFGRKGKRK